MRKLVFGVPILIYILVVVFKVPLFEQFKKIYKVQKNQVVVQSEPIEATESGLTPAQKVEQILGSNKEVKVDDDTFTDWAVLEDGEGGYRLIYPAGFKIEYQYGKVDIWPPSGKGKVSVYIKGGDFEVKTYTEGLSIEDKNMILAAGKLVESTFEFTIGQTYDKKAAEGRFK